MIQIGRALIEVALAEEMSYGHLRLDPALSPYLLGGLSEEEEEDVEAVGEPEFVAAASRPQFAELAEEPVYTPLPRDYASDFGNELGSSAAVEERGVHTVASPLSAPAEEPERDLDVPAFMRRLKF